MQHVTNFHSWANFVSHIHKKIIQNPQKIQWPQGVFKSSESKICVFLPGGWMKLLAKRVSIDTIPETLFRTLSQTLSLK